MLNLGEILKKRTTQSPMWKGVTAALVVEEANLVISEIFGEQIREFAQAVYLKNDTLSIACLSSVVGQELKLNEKQIIFKLTSKFGQGVVKELKYLA